MVCTVYDVYIQRFVYNTCMVWYGTVRYSTVWYVYMYVSVCVSVRTWVCNGMAWHGMVCMYVKYTLLYIYLSRLWICTTEMFDDHTDLPLAKLIKCSP